MTERLREPRAPLLTREGSARLEAYGVRVCGPAPAALGQWICVGYGLMGMAADRLVAYASWRAGLPLWRRLALWWQQLRSTNR